MVTVVIKLSTTFLKKMFEKMPAFYVKEAGMKALKNGNQLKFEDIKEDFSEKVVDGQAYRVYDYQGIFYGIYSYTKQRRLFCPVKLFLPEL